jgi:hypothetical protein
MKKIILVILMVFMAVIVFAKEKNDHSVMILKGHLIDNKCAGSQDSRQMEEFVKSHSKECALSPECQKSGYAIFASDHQMYMFDKASNARIKSFLKKPGSGLLVEVEVKKKGQELELISIKNR